MTTAADFRAEIARRQIRRYELAAMIHLNPQRLGSMLSERIPMPEDVAVRLRNVLAREPTV
jgi:plasmid maintenance system antidote protein VapI